MSNAIQLHQDTAIQPTNMQELMSLAKHAAATNFYGAKSPEQALLLMMRGRDLGWSYTQALAGFHVIEGRPALTADAVAALAMSDPRCEYLRPVEQTPTSATWEIKVRGEDTPRRSTFTVADAQAAGLVKEKSGWTKYPGRMCSARAKAFLVRDTFPDRLMGLITTDEAQEIADERRERPSVAQAQPRTVAAAEVVEAQPSPADALRRQIVEASTRAEMDAAVAAIKVATSAGDITDDERKELAAAFQARVAELSKRHEQTAGAAQ